jgi:predicted nucleic acid-binding protein
MRVYADSSFIVKLLARESGTEEASAEYRRLGRPTLAFLPLHALEVENAIRAKSFHRRKSLASGDRLHIAREEAASLQRLEHFINRGVFVKTEGDWNAACGRATSLSRQYTRTTGARSLDLLHLAFALELDSELLLSTDDCQAKVATLEGLDVVRVRD